MKMEMWFRSKDDSLSPSHSLGSSYMMSSWDNGEVTMWSLEIHLTSSHITRCMQLRTGNRRERCLECSVKRGAQTRRLQPSSWNPCCPVCQEPSRWGGALCKPLEFAAWIPVVLALFPFTLSQHFKQEVQGWKFDYGGLFFFRWCFVVVRTVGSLSPSCPFAHFFSWAWQP